MASSRAGSDFNLEVGGGSLPREAVDVGGRSRSERGAFGGERVLVGVLVPFLTGERERDRWRGRSRSLSGLVSVLSVISQMNGSVLLVHQTNPSKIFVYPDFDSSPVAFESHD